MGEQDILLEASRHADFARHQAEGDITHSSFMGCRDFFTNTGKFFSPDEDSIASCREPGMGDDGQLRPRAGLRGRDRRSRPRTSPPSAALRRSRRSSKSPSLPRPPGGLKFPVAPERQAIALGLVEHRFKLRAQRELSGPLLQGLQQLGQLGFQLLRRVADASTDKPAFERYCTFLEKSARTGCQYCPAHSLLLFRWGSSTGRVHGQARPRRPAAAGLVKRTPESLLFHLFLLEAFALHIAIPLLMRCPQPRPSAAHMGLGRRRN